MRAHNEKHRNDHAWANGKLQLSPSWTVLEGWAFVWEPLLIRRKVVLPVPGVQCEFQDKSSSWLKQTELISFCLFQWKMLLLCSFSHRSDCNHSRSPGNPQHRRWIILEPRPSWTVELWSRSGLSDMCCRLQQQNRSWTSVIGRRLWRASRSSSTCTHAMVYDRLNVQTAILMITTAHIMWMIMMSIKTFRLCQESPITPLAICNTLLVYGPI